MEHSFSHQHCCAKKIRTSPRKTTNQPHQNFRRIRHQRQKDRKPLEKSWKNPSSGSCTAQGSSVHKPVRRTYPASNFIRGGSMHRPVVMSTVTHAATMLLFVPVNPGRDQSPPALGRKGTPTEKQHKHKHQKSRNVYALKATATSRDG